MSTEPRTVFTDRRTRWRAPGKLYPSVERNGRSEATIAGRRVAAPRCDGPAQHRGYRGEGHGLERVSARERIAIIPPVRDTGRVVCDSSRRQGRARGNDLDDDDVDTPRLAGTVRTRSCFGGSRAEWWRIRRRGSPGQEASATGSDGVSAGISYGIPNPMSVTG
jgi:hypothetical protein